MEAHIPAFVLLLALLIVVAKGGAWLSLRLHQPAILGELIAGLILGPSLLNVFSWPIFHRQGFSETVLVLGEIGVILLMGMAGLEIELEEFLKARRVALLAGTAGVIAPLVLGALVAYPFHGDLPTSIYVGLVLSATSVSISAQTLLELGRLRSPEGIALLGAAVVDDVLALLALAVFTSVVNPGGEPGGGAGGLLLALARMGLFLVLAFLLARRVLPRVATWVQGQPVSEGLIALAFVAILALAGAAEELGGLAAITGAFLAGLGLSSHPARHTIFERLRPAAYGFFVPLFLVGVGLRADLRTMSPEGLLFTVALIAVAVLSKVIGCGAGAWLGGFRPLQAWRLGLGMVSRGEVGLILASLGLSAGFLKPYEFVGVVAMVVATTLLTPILLRWSFGPRGRE
ncbi:cation:proton antiporter [Thermoflexus sp.]|uniref:cation:proton antiporter n=1 Tax=Thermoflexus sp. TaxID=1969742 RepID=UPI0035E44E0E